MADSMGATGASPSPSSNSGVKGASPAQNNTTTPASKPSSPAQTGKMDYGMGPSSGKSQQSVKSEPELYGEDWWATHGEGVFKHEKFRELNSYKQKYSELEPLKQFAEKMGGFDQLQDLVQVVGPVYSKLLSLGDNAASAWGKIIPYLNAFLNDQDLPEYGKWDLSNAGNTDDVEDEDPVTPKLKPFEDRMERIENEFKTRDQREQQKNRDTNLNRYHDLLVDRLKSVDPTGTLTVEDVVPFIVPNLWQYMPKTS